MALRMTENTPLYQNEDDFESDGGFNSTNSQRRPYRSSPSSLGSCVWSLCQVLTLFLMMAVLFYQEARVSTISSQMEQQSETIRGQQHDLQAQASKLQLFNLTLGNVGGFEEYVSSHIHLLETSMSKFNKTVTNAQVVEQVGDMEIKLNDMVVYLNESLNSMLSTVSSTMKTASFDIHRELDLAQTDILERLGQTNNDLNDAVVTAKREIQEEVNTVRASMDQYVQDTNSQFKAENDFLKYQLAGTFTLLGILIAIWHVTQHVRHMWLPTVQRRVLAILWMVPVYGVTSWLSLVFPIARSQLGMIRDWYEAYAVYTFFAFLCEVLRGDSPDQENDMDLILIIEENARHKKATGHGSLRPPLYCPCGLDQYSLRMLSRAALRQSRFCLMQFVLLKPLLTLTPFLCTLMGINYANHAPLTSSHIPDLTSPMLYVMVISNVSVSLAFYGLVSFYHLVDSELQWVDPWPKFLCIKGVVFMTFWQGFIINLCGQFGYIDAETAVSAQDFLICIEMLLASIAHFYIFPHSQWQPGYREQKIKDAEMGTFRASDNFAFPDFYRDLKQMARHDSFSHSSHGDKVEGTIEEGEGSGSETNSFLLLDDTHELETTMEQDTSRDKTMLTETLYGLSTMADDPSDTLLAQTTERAEPGELEEEEDKQSDDNDDGQGSEAEGGDTSSHSSQSFHDVGEGSTGSDDEVEFSEVVVEKVIRDDNGDGMNDDEEEDDNNVVDEEDNDNDDDDDENVVDEEDNDNGDDDNENVLDDEDNDNDDNEEEDNENVGREEEEIDNKKSSVVIEKEVGHVETFVEEGLSPDMEAQQPPDSSRNMTPSDMHTSEQDIRTQDDIHDITSEQDIRTQDEDHGAPSPPDNQAQDDHDVFGLTN